MNSSHSYIPSSTQSAAQARETKVDDSFFNHFVYEMINVLIEKHLQRPKEKQNLKELCGEVESIGAMLGKKVTDLLAQD